MKDMTALKIMLYSALLFVLSAICAGFIGKMIITDTAYYIVSPCREPLGFLTVLKQMKEASVSTLTQLLVVFISGFSFFSVVSITAVNIVRGIVFGFSTSWLISGIAVGKGILPSAILFALASVVVLIFSAVSVCFFKYIRTNGVTFLGVIRYTSRFFVCSGCVILLDSARLLFL